MHSFTKSLLGPRAFLILAFSVLSFFAFQHVSVHDIDKAVTAASTASVDVAYLVKRVGIPFGDTSISNLTSPSDTEPTAHANHQNLVKRSDPWTLTYHDAVCRGQKLHEMIQEATKDSRTWTVKQMIDTNGWNLPDKHLSTLPQALKDAIAAHHIELSDFRERHAELEKPFINDAGHEVQQDCGYYRQAYNAKDGAIIAVDNASPGYCANYGVDPPHSKEEILALIPPLNTLSDVTWTVWQDTAGKPMAPALQYIFQDNVANPNSKHIIEVAMGLDDNQPGKLNHDNLHAPWPGKTFSIEDGDEEAFAMLGTPQGTGTAFLMMGHKGG